MNRLIRWQGLLGLGIFISLLAAFVYLFADNIVKYGLISASEKSLGAEVNIEAVELHYFPTSISIIELQATDPKKPEQNLFSWNKLTATFDLWEYLQGKVIIEDVEVSEVRFSQTRLKPGKIYHKHNESSTDEANTEKSGLGLEEVQLPDVKTLLADSDLITVKNGEILAASYQSEKEKLLTLQSQLPDKAKLEEYRAQVKALSKRKIKSLSDVNEVKDEFNELKKQFEAEKTLIKKAKKQIADSKTLLTQQVETLKNSPDQDWKNIEKKYQLDKVSADDFAHILFGEQARKYTQYTTKAWEYIEPLLQKSASDENNDESKAELSDTGRFVHFITENELPAFWLKRAVASVYIANKEYALNINDLTYQHWLIDASSEILLALSNDATDDENTAKSEQINARYLFAIEPQGDFNAQGKWSIAQVPLSRIDLATGAKFSLALMQGKLDLDGDIEQNNSNISSANAIVLSELVYEGNAQGHISEVVLDTVASAPELDLNVKVTGEASDPSIAIDSPINAMLADSLQKQIQTKLSGFKTELQAGLQEKVSKSLSGSEKDAQELQDLDKSLDALDSSLTDLIDTKMTDQYKDKLKSKLGKLFG